MSEKAAILIVNGGKDPEYGKWIRLCLDKIIENTLWRDFCVYVWNNNVYDIEIIEYLKHFSNVSLIQASPVEILEHFHAVPLQRLYKRALNEGAKYIITMDSDAHPIRSGWLSYLISHLNEETPLSGVWRDELSIAIDPYIHPSCLCTTANFIEKNGLRLDYIAPNTDETIHDTLSFLTDRVSRLNLKCYKLLRSNTRNFHRLMGGIYGSYVYHHGAGSREKFRFWDEPSIREIEQINGEIGRKITQLVFNHYSEYMAWLSGKDLSANISATMDELQILSRQAQDIASYPLKFQSKVGEYSFLKGKRLLRKVLRKFSFNKDQKALPKPPLAMLREVSQEDLREIPSDWEVTGPDFIGVGTPKAGTSWWYSLILNHPQVVPHRLFREDIPVSKELLFFLHQNYQGIRKDSIGTYRQAFSAPQNSICGEWSTQYLCYPFSIQYLKQAAPNAKVLVLLRNPIDRMISHINHVLSNRARVFGFDKSDNYDLFRIHSVYPEAALNSLYAHGLQQLLRYFRREDILILQYEKCKTYPVEEIQRTYRFLGISPDYTPEMIFKPINKLHYVIKPPNANQRLIIASYFQDDVNRVIEMFPEVDLSLWADFLNPNLY